MQSKSTAPLIAIACGGTGGHLFPGVAVAHELVQRDCDVMLLISPKEVDQQAIKSAVGMEIVTLPAVGLTRGNVFNFVRGFWGSYRAAKKVFKKRKPQAVLSMGGFTSAAPVLAAHHLGSKIFLHESNTIPGKANRWLAHFADEAFVYFHETSGRLYLQKIETVGMPVRQEFREPVDAAAARMALGLQANKPVLLVMGGSQGASGINSVVISALPAIAKELPDLQFLHLTGSTDFERVRKAYEAARVKAVVQPFLTEMDFALGAATVAVSRSGASSLAELAALGVPAILIPYPHAADNHQHHNALAFVDTGAALTFEQKTLKPDRFAAEVIDLVTNQERRDEIVKSLERWRTPDAAARVADRILASIDNVTAGQGRTAVTEDGPQKPLQKLKAGEANA